MVLSCNVFYLRPCVCVPFPCRSYGGGCSPHGGVFSAPPAGGRAEALHSLWLSVWHVWTAWCIWHQGDSKEAVSRAVCCRAQLCGFICVSGGGAAVSQIWQSNMSAFCLHSRVHLNVVCVYWLLDIWHKEIVRAVSLPPLHSLLC